jgi:hypothetical protein
VPPNCRPEKSVVYAKRVVGIVIVVRVRKQITAPTAVCRGLREIVDHRVVLPAQRDRAVIGRRQPDERLAAEHAATLAQRTAVHVKTVFEVEDRLQAAAQIFRSLEAPAAALRVAALQLIGRLVTRVVRVVDALVEYPVQRNAALCVHRQGDGCGHRQCNHFLFHEDLPNL